MGGGSSSPRVIRRVEAASRSAKPSLVVRCRALDAAAFDCSIARGDPAQRKRCEERDSG
jgi:hypothetical protein